MTIGSFFVALVTVAATHVAAMPSVSERVSLPAYKDISHASLYATKAAYDAAVGDRHFRMTRIKYESDSLQVYAYVYRSVSPRSRQPIIIFNRGSFTWPTGFAGELVTMAHR